MDGPAMTFSLDGAELITANEWTERHNKKHRGRHGFSYEFSHSSGIGIKIVVHCECGEEKDVTDYGSW
jgi:hypothetical protein